MLSRKYTIKELSEITAAKLSGDTDKLSDVIDRIATDSRYQGIGRSSCFFAIKTEHNDGHRYIKDAYQKGVRCFAVEDDIPEEELPGAVFLHVQHSLNALQELGRFHRKEIKYTILGITGSNGKTIIKEWLFQILSSKMITARSPKSYNSQIGVPLSLVTLPLEAEIGILEAGISRTGEMEKLERMIKPDLGIFTNIHRAHLENFKNTSEIVKEKLSLFKDCATLIYRKDYAEIHRQIKEDERFSQTELISWSDNAKLEADIYVDWKSSGDFSVINLIWKNKELSFKLPFGDKASMENAVHCIVAAKTLGLEEDKIKEIVRALSPVAMRLQQLQGVNNCTLINDTYNSDITSLEIALNFLNMQRQHERRTLILSDIFQSGIPDAELYKGVDRMCIDNGIDRIIGIGTSILSRASSFSVPFSGFRTTEELLDHIKDFSFYNETILIKGSRKFGFERVSNQLEHKKHETTLEVNLSAVIDNLNYFKSTLKPGVGIMAMVKAFSYGTGSYEIANVLAHHGVDYLTVAYIDEGIVLRKRGINVPIMVMNPAIGELEDMSAYNLEPEVYNVNDLHIIDHFTRKTGKVLNIHLKIESGMHRLGIDKSKLNEVVDLVSSNVNIEVKSVFSHLVASDNSEMDDFTRKQTSMYLAFCDDLEKNGITNFKRHLLNSDGILRFPDYQFDMVRLGIGIYGLSSIPKYREKLRSVVTLKSRISQIKEVKKGESIGYGRNFLAGKDMKSATVPIGYADGLVRELGNGNWYFRINNQKARIIGNICMDMTMIDVSDMADIREKDEVLILSGNKDIYKMAEKRHTIPYEILTSISERVKRIFYYGD